MKLESLKEVLSEFLTYNWAKELLNLLTDRKTILELFAIALIGKGFKFFWPQLTKVQLKRDFIQNLIDFKVRFCIFWLSLELNKLRPFLNL